MSPPVPPALLEAIPALDYLEGQVTVKSTWEWFAAVGLWGLRFQTLSSGGETALWYALARDDYPHGPINVMPAAEGGIALTFAHQSANRRGDPDLPWRAGKLCLVGPLAFIRRHDTADEPLEPGWRLLWHIERALEWVDAAESGRLVREGDPFELPDFSARGNSTWIHREPSDGLAYWGGRLERAGSFEFVRLVRASGNIHLVVLRFLDAEGRELFAPQWGTAIVEAARQQQALRGHGIWVRLDTVPHLSPWAAPRSWLELDEAVCAQGFDLPAMLSEALGCTRHHPVDALLIGFAIPERVGESPAASHWQPLSIDRVERDKKGFAGASRPAAKVDRLLGRNKPLQWQRAENWDPARLGSRGRVTPALTSARVCLIGAGALGGHLAVGMVRAGVEDLLLFDNDVVEAVNLVRAPYGLDHLGFAKASALAFDLNRLSPLARVLAVTSDFPPTAEPDAVAARGCSVVIDCTADNGLLRHLGTFDWGGERLFASFSLGFGAKRLFCYGLQAERFGPDDLRDRLAPWLERERADHGEEDYPREGLGCWNPVFPARVDDIATMAGIALHTLELFATDPPLSGRLVVYTARYQDGALVAIEREGEN